MQADICEFFLNFLERMQDGLGENKTLIRKMMGEELIKDLKNEGMLSEEVSNNALEISRIEYNSPLINLAIQSDKESDFDFNDTQASENDRKEFARQAFAS